MVELLRYILSAILAIQITYFMLDDFPKSLRNILKRMKENRKWGTMRSEEEIIEDLEITNMLIKQNKELLSRHFDINTAIAIHVLQENRSELLWVLEDSEVKNDN